MWILVIKENTKTVNNANNAIKDAKIVLIKTLASSTMLWTWIKMEIFVKKIKSAFKDNVKIVTSLAKNVLILKKSIALIVLKGMWDIKTYV